MVKIRYAELPAGLHVTAQAERSGTVVYLLPGLTADQRRTALFRARSSARMGHGPALPAPAMAVAIAADRASTTTHNGAAAVRRHPMVILPPLLAVAAGAVVLILMSFAALRVAPHGSAVPGAVPTMGIGAGDSASFQHSAVVPSTGIHRAAITSRRRSRRHRALSASAPGYSATLPATSSPNSPQPSPSRTRGSPRPSPSPSPSASDTCLKLGPLGLCVTT